MFSYLFCVSERCECVLITSASWFLVAQYQQWVSSLIPAASSFFYRWLIWSCKSGNSRWCNWHVWQLNFDLLFPSYKIYPFWIAPVQKKIRTVNCALLSDRNCALTMTCFSEKDKPLPKLLCIYPYWSATVPMNNLADCVSISK